MARIGSVRTLGWLASAAAAGLLCPIVWANGPASAQGAYSGSVLARALAVEAASAAIQACEANDYRVTATVVDAAGDIRALIRGDGSTPHTKETAYRKAYTQITLGPIFAFDALGTFVEKMKGNPVQSSFLTVPNIILLPGAVAVKARGETIAAIGVGGAPGGDKDEACAAAGLARIADRLPK